METICHSKTHYNWDYSNYNSTAAQHALHKKQTAMYSANRDGILQIHAICRNYTFYGECQTNTRAQRGFIQSVYLGIIMECMKL